MSRIARTLPVSAKLYRHFAVVTVVITVCVALFADGETHATVADEIETRQTRNELVEHEVNKLGVRRQALGALHIKTGGGWGDGGGGGGDMGGGGSAMLPNDYTVMPPDAVLLDPLAARSGGENIPKVLPAGMAPEDYAGAGAGPNRKRVGAAKRLSPQELDSIAAASRARTGRSEYAAD